jgi:hypothetical protein
MLKWAALSCRATIGTVRKLLARRRTWPVVGRTWRAVECMITRLWGSGAR